MTLGELLATVDSNAMVASTSTYDINGEPTVTGKTDFLNTNLASGWRG